jgi:hypothetical protein
VRLDSSYLTLSGEFEVEMFEVRGSTFKTQTYPRVNLERPFQTRTRTSSTSILTRSFNVELGTSNLEQAPLASTLALTLQLS